MRFIDVAIPKFGDDSSDSQAVERPAIPASSPSRHFSRGGGFLQRPNIEEYNLEENESVVDDPGTADADEHTDQFFEAPEITSDVSLRVLSLEGLFGFSR